MKKKKRRKATKEQSPGQKGETAGTNGAPSASRKLKKKKKKGMAIPAAVVEPEEEDDDEMPHLVPIDMVSPPAQKEKVNSYFFIWPKSLFRSASLLSQVCVTLSVVGQNLFLLRTLKASPSSGCSLLNRNGTSDAGGADYRFQRLISPKN